MIKIITYIKMSLLFMVLGALVLYVAGAPLVDYVTSHGKLAMVKGAPGYPGESYPTMSRLDMRRNRSEDMSEIQEPAPGTPYGTIESVRIALTAPLYYGDDDKSLQSGAGQYTGSGLPGQGKPILISGHDGTFFAPLEQIEIGDILTITTEYGSFDYQVTETKVADASDFTVYDLTKDKEQLILYTCYPFGALIGDRSDRFFVYGDPIITDIQYE